MRHTLKDMYAPIKRIVDTYKQPAPNRAAAAPITPIVVGTCRGRHGAQLSQEHPDHRQVPQHSEHSEHPEHYVPENLTEVPPQQYVRQPSRGGTAFRNLPEDINFDMSFTSPRGASDTQHQTTSAVQSDAGHQEPDAHPSNTPRGTKTPNQPRTKEKASRHTAVPTATCVSTFKTINGLWLRTTGYDYKVDWDAEPESWVDNADFGVYTGSKATHTAVGFKVPFRVGSRVKCTWHPVRYGAPIGVISKIYNDGAVDIEYDKERPTDSWNDGDHAIDLFNLDGQKVESRCKCKHSIIKWELC